MFSPEQEKVNGSIHIAGALLALVGGYLIFSTHNYQPLETITYGVYIATLFATLLSSGLYHLNNFNRILKAKLQELDRFFIFTLIAGTYTPILVFMYPDEVKWFILAGIWLVASIAIVLRYLFRNDTLDIYLYLLLAYNGIFYFNKFEVVDSFYTYLYIGGAGYMIGLIFYFLDKKLYWGHAAWHVCVLIGAAAHYLMNYNILQ